jgi:hypothetical protein
MAYSQTKNRNLGKLWRVLQWKMLVRFGPFGLFYVQMVYILTYCHLEHFVVIWYFFPVLVCRNKKNLATLLRERERERGLEGTAFFSALLKRVERISSGVDGAKLYLRVARFFLVHYTKTGKNVPNEHKMYLMVIKYPKCL